MGSIDFRKGSELLKIVEQAYAKENLKLLLYKISPFSGINENEFKDISKNIAIMPFKKGQIVELRQEDDLYIVSEGKMISAADAIGTNSTVYQCGDIIYKPLFKLAGEENGELLKLNEKIVQRLAEISEPFKGKIDAELKKREKYAKPASNKQKGSESVAHVMPENPVRELSSITTKDSGMEPLSLKNDLSCQVWQPSKGVKEQKPANMENSVEIKKEEKKKERLNAHEVRLLLSASPAFGSIGLEEKSKIAKYAELACFDKNQEIIKAGTFGEGKFYIIKKGQVKIIKANSRGNIITVGWLEEGDFIGEHLLIYNVKNNETIISLTNIELLALDKKASKTFMIIIRASRWQ